MKVYLVKGGWEHEGFDVLSVHKSKKSAEKFIKNYKEARMKNNGYLHDYYDIDEHEVFP